MYLCVCVCICLHVRYQTNINKYVIWIQHKIFLEYSGNLLYCFDDYSLTASLDCFATSLSSCESWEPAGIFLRHLGCLSLRLEDEGKETRGR